MARPRRRSDAEAGEYVARVVSAYIDAGESHRGGGEDGDKPKAALDEDEPDGYRAGDGGMIAGKREV